MIKFELLLSIFNIEIFIYCYIKEIYIIYIY